MGDAKKLLLVGGILVESKSNRRRNSSKHAHW